MALKVAYFDVEGMGLLHDIRSREDMHIIVCSDVDIQAANPITRTRVFFDEFTKRKSAQWIDFEDDKDGDLKDGIEYLMQMDVLIAQNQSGYDYIAFENCFPEWKFDYFGTDGCAPFLCKTVDTLVLSQLLKPDRRPPPQAYAMGRGDVPPHGLEAHGIRIGRPKPPIDDWSSLTDDMVTRCIEDNAIGFDFFEYLIKELAAKPEKVTPYTGKTFEGAYLSELRLSMAMARQEYRGFTVDMAWALNQVAEIDVEMQEVEDAFSPHIPLKIEKVKLKVPINGCEHGSKWATLNSILTKDFQFKKAVTKHYPECRGFYHDHENPLVTGPITPISYKKTKISSRQEMKLLLYDNGWLGVNYSDKEQRDIDNGVELNPWAGKIDEDSITAWKKRRDDVPDWCVGIAKWYILTSRRNQLLNKKDCEYYEKHGQWPMLPKQDKRGCRGIVAMALHSEKHKPAHEFYRIYGKWPSDGVWRLPAEARPCATNTFRMTHKKVVNIPSRGLRPLRKAFIAAPGKKLCICDAKGLELRMLAHFMNDPKYTDIVLNHDIHNFHMQMGDMPSRDTAKKFIYMWIYGSGIPLLATTLGMSRAAVSVMIDTFVTRLVALGSLKDAVTEVAKEKEYLLALDGRSIFIRKAKKKIKEHTVLNCLLQADGSIVCKYGHNFAEETLIKEEVALDSRGWPTWLEFTHDEFGLEVPEHEVEEVSYSIPINSWGEEEKKDYVLDGKLYSAPVKLITNSRTIEIARYYHRAGEILATSIAKAGDFFNLRCPMGGEYKIGNNWQECH